MDLGRKRLSGADPVRGRRRLRHPAMAWRRHRAHRLGRTRTEPRRHLHGQLGADGTVHVSVKHIGLSWASSDSNPPATPAAFIGPAIIRAAVTLNHAGNAFEGTFTLDQYARDEMTLLEHIGGHIKAARFTVD
jgi:hypothetical protein